MSKKGNSSWYHDGNKNSVCLPKGKVFLKETQSTQLLHGIMHYKAHSNSQEWSGFSQLSASIETLKDTLIIILWSKSNFDTVR